jgi:LuxR family transcriptional regulator, maltose regulon positive regulatory protein
LTLLAHWLSVLDTAQRQGSRIELYMLQALAFHLDHQADRAMEPLARTLALAEPEGYIRLFVDEGEVMRFLIFDFGFWIEQQVKIEMQTNFLTYTNKLLSAFTGLESPPDEINALSTKIQNPKSKIQNLIEPLTDREIEVLRLVTAGLSNADIAEQLVVSVGTVKTHLKHIFGKLAVQSRTQAIAQARVLRLLE